LDRRLGDPEVAYIAFRAFTRLHVS